jgi:Ca-activated chloride channel family protein
LSVIKLLFLSLLLCFSVTHAEDFNKNFNQSVDFSQKKNFKGAISELEKIVKPDGREKEYYYQLGTLYCLEKKFSKCINELKKALLKDPEDRRINRNLEIAYMEKKKKKGEKKQDKQDKKKKNKDKNKQKSKAQMDKFNKKFNTQRKSHEFIEQKIFKKRLEKKLENPNQRFKKDW